MDAPSPKDGRGTLPWIGSGFHPWPGGESPPSPQRAAGDDPLAAFLATLDPPVRPLVSAMNRTGWLLTVFSCGGHPEEPDSLQWGRRQAHIDVLVQRDHHHHWKAFVKRCQDHAPAAVASLQFDQKASIRCTEASLGDLPPWLAEAVSRQTPSRPTDDAGSWARRRLWRRARGPWLYRRLVFEPVPYTLTPAVSRRVLDVALSAALDAVPSQEHMDK